jgi:DNL zinc finger
MISRIKNAGPTVRVNCIRGATGNISWPDQRWHLVSRDAGGPSRSFLAAAKSSFDPGRHSAIATRQKFNHLEIFLIDGRSRSWFDAFAYDRYQHLQRRTLVTDREDPPPDGVSREQVTSSPEITIPGAKTGGRKLAIIFTCTHCNTRSVKQFSEKAYTQGVVIATCPGCQSKHLIADNLGYFSDESGGWNVQKGMEKLGANVKVATNDNVLELSLEDIFTAEAIDEAVNQASGNATPKRDDKNSPKDTQP